MELHIGREIEKKFEESGLKPVEFAKRINTGPRNIYTIFKRKDINSGQLQKISEALKFDFFSLYRANLSTPTVGEPNLEYFKNARIKDVQVTVPLDGTDRINEWISVLTRLNKALN